MNKISLETTQAHFKEIIKKGYSLDAVFLLSVIESGESIIDLGPKGENLLKTLWRKGLIKEEDFSILPKGQELLNFLSSREEIPVLKRAIVKKEPLEDDLFLKWWKKYPSTDTFSYKNRKFTGSRALKTKKDECRVKFDKILLEGEYTTDMLIAALELEINQKLEASIKTGTNKMTFMQNSFTYLHQRTFESFMDLITNNNIEESKLIKGVDI